MMIIRQFCNTNIFFQRQHAHFGPDGVKPPTCGGPASGYVCCRVSAAENGFTQFITAPSNHNQHSSPSAHVNHVGNLLSGGPRPSRAQSPTTSSVNSQQFSNFGQCGKRNAQGLTGRIAANDFREGDTDFGKKHVVLIFIFKLYDLKNLAKLSSDFLLIQIHSPMTKIIITKTSTIPSFHGIISDLLTIIIIIIHNAVRQIQKLKFFFQKDAYSLHFLKISSPLCTTPVFNHATHLNL